MSTWLQTTLHVCNNAEKSHKQFIWRWLTKSDFLLFKDHIYKPSCTTLLLRFMKTLTTRFASLLCFQLFYISLCAIGCSIVGIPSLIISVFISIIHTYHSCTFYTALLTFLAHPQYHSGGPLCNWTAASPLDQFSIWPRHQLIFRPKLYKYSSDFK